MAVGQHYIKAELAAKHFGEKLFQKNEKINLGSLLKENHYSKI